MEKRVLRNKLTNQKTDKLTNSLSGSCQVISMKKCTDKTLYYLTKSPNANYAMCIETDVCSMVEGTPLDETWRLSGTLSVSGVGWGGVGVVFGVGCVG